MLRRMHLNTIYRAFCTLSPSPDLSSLSPSLQPAAHRVVAAISCANEAAERAKSDESDDDERREAVQKTRYALSLYVDLASRDDPPVKLSPNASQILDEENDAMQSEDEMISKVTPHDPPEQRVSLADKKLEARNEVMRVFGEEVRKMKEATFVANRQRVWFGWRGWF